jgi:hypothetical protein
MVLLRYISALSMLLLATRAVVAQPQVTLAPAKVGTVPSLVRVAVPPAVSVALSETLGYLAFAHERSYVDAHVSLVKLDAKGNPAAYCTSWKLPRPPEVLAKFGFSALSVAFHPKLPLLYVWQDVGLNYGVPLTGQPPAWSQFDHLLIYSIAKETPELVVSLFRGEQTHFGMSGGALAVDPAGEFLYVPSVCEAKSRFLHFGRFRLDGDGMPLADTADLKLPLPARIKKLVERSVAKTLTPTQITPIEYVHVLPMNLYGGANSIYLLSKDAIITGGPHGVVTWRPDDKLATMHALPVKTPGQTLVSAHPTLPYLFATTANTDSFFRVAHADGYLSQLPLQITLPQTRLFSTPMVFDKGKRVAVGGHYYVYIVSLDAKGEPEPAVIKVPVLSPTVRTLIYSERWDRLYVGVEVSK